MSDTGFKVSLPGVDVRTALNEELVASTILPTWKCDLRPADKLYGTVNFTIATIGAGVTKIIYQIAHPYTYIPSFIDAWSYPAGTTSPGNADNQTFGIGDIDCTLGSQMIYTVKTDITNFTIDATNYSGGTLTDLSGSIRFYVFADDFTAV